jgi:hypothetical protein
MDYADPRLENRETWGAHSFKNPELEESEDMGHPSDFSTLIGGEGRLPPSMP